MNTSLILDYIIGFHREKLSVMSLGSLTSSWSQVSVQQGISTLSIEGECFEDMISRIFAQSMESLLKGVSKVFQDNHIEKIHIRGFDIRIHTPIIYELEALCREGSNCMEVLA